MFYYAFIILLTVKMQMVQVVQQLQRLNLRKFTLKNEIRFVLDS